MSIAQIETIKSPAPNINPADYCISGFGTSQSYRNNIKSFIGIKELDVDDVLNANISYNEFNEPIEIKINNGNTEFIVKQVEPIEIKVISENTEFIVKQVGDAAEYAAFIKIYDYTDNICLQFIPGFTDIKSNINFIQPADNGMDCQDIKLTMSLYLCKVHNYLIDSLLDSNGANLTRHYLSRKRDL